MNKSNDSKYVTASKQANKTVILKKKMLNEKSTQLFNILHQSNVKKSHATRLKSLNKIPIIW